MNAPAIQAIETHYAGHRFRSRLEARVAVMLNHLGIAWEYEPQGVKVGGVCYLPDFHAELLCGAQSVFIEVKGNLGRNDLAKILPLAEAGWPVLVVDRIPKMAESGPHFYLFRRRPTTRQGVDVHRVSVYSTVGAGWSVQPFGWPLSVPDLNDETVLKTLPDLLVDRHPGETSGWMDVPPDLEQAFRAARSARFEFGESG